jgi:glycosyltransferase involved in cell wall biosynthesis
LVVELMAAVVHVMGWRSQQYGSFERFLVSLAARCANERIASHFVFHSEPASGRFVSDAHADCHRLPPSRIPGDPVFALRLRTLLKRVRATHLHVHFGLDSYNALAVGRLFGVENRFATKHHTPGASPYTLSGTRHRALAAQVKTYFAVSDWVARRLIGLGVPEAKVRTCRLGVDPSAYRPDGAARQRLRQQLMVEEGDRLLLSTSHLRPGKGVELLPGLLKGLLAEPGNVTLMVAGDGPMRDPLERAARELALPPGRFRLLGVREDVPELLAAADVFVFPTSTSEGLGLGPLEALSAGVPTVCSAVGDLPTLLRDAAVMVPPGDLASLVRACRDLLADREKAAQLAHSGRELVRARLNVSWAAGFYLEHYLADAPP